MKAKFQQSLRPTCQTPDCGKPVKLQRRNRDGTSQWGKICAVCALVKAAQSKGMTLSEYRKWQLQSAAAKAGLTVAEYCEKSLERQAAKRGMTVSEYRRYKNESTAKKHGLTRAEYSAKLRHNVAAKNGLSRAAYEKKQREKVAAKRGLTLSQYEQKRREELASRLGLTVSEYKNRYHPYRKHRKDFCENRDGRFGYRCRYKIRHMAQLQVDHINGNPKDNDPSNLQTLCANCHIFKTHSQQDYLTPGRKSLRCS